MPRHTALRLGTNGPDSLWGLNNSGISNEWITAFQGELSCCSWTLEGSRGTVWKIPSWPGKTFCFPTLLLQSFIFIRKIKDYIIKCACSLFFKEETAFLYISYMRHVFSLKKLYWLLWKNSKHFKKELSTITKWYRFYF